MIFSTGQDRSQVPEYMHSCHQHIRMCLLARKVLTEFVEYFWSALLVSDRTSGHMSFHGLLLASICLFLCHSLGACSLQASRGPQSPQP